MSEILEKVGLKICSKCGQMLPVSEFGKCKSFKDGLQYNCKSCQNEHVTKWRNENREHVNEQKQRWREENSEQLQEQRQDPKAKRKHQVSCLTNRAIARGELIRPDACSQCGDNTHIVQAHHWSYELGDELDVLWLCPKCHTTLHKRNKID